MLETFSHGVNWIWAVITHVIFEQLWKKEEHNYATCLICYIWLLENFLKIPLIVKKGNFSPFGTYVIYSNHLQKLSVFTTSHSNCQRQDTNLVCRAFSAATHLFNSPSLGTSCLHKAMAENDLFYRSSLLSFSPQSCPQTSLICVFDFMWLVLSLTLYYFQMTEQSALKTVWCGPSKKFLKFNYLLIADLPIWTLLIL